MSEGSKKTPTVRVDIMRIYPLSPSAPVPLLTLKARRSAGPRNTRHADLALQHTQAPSCRVIVLHHSYLPFVLSFPTNHLAVCKGSVPIFLLTLCVSWLTATFYLSRFPLLEICFLGYWLAVPSSHWMLTTRKGAKALYLLYHLITKHFC